MSGEAVRPRLLRRARLLDDIRRFFAERDVVEVATPALSAAAATDPSLASIGCEVAALGGRHYLHTSPEHAMKRLLAAGSGDIWQLARVFRDGELGRWHQPEFLLLEWYRTGFDELALMDEVFELLDRLARAAGRRLGRMDLAYADAFAASFGIDALRFDRADRDRLRQRLRTGGVDVPDGLAPDALLDLALSVSVVPAWPRGTAVFLHGYPVTQAALAAIRPGPRPVAARFEVFVDGIELGNGFRELTDAAEQRRRFESDLARRRERGLPAVPVDEDLLRAIADGLPECAGVAVGLDRLIALLEGADELAAAVSWPHARRHRED